MGRRKRRVLDGLLTALQDAVRLLEQIRNLEWRFTVDNFGLLNIGLAGRSK